MPPSTTWVRSRDPGQGGADHRTDRRVPGPDGDDEPRVLRTVRGTSPAVHAASTRTASTRNREHRDRQEPRAMVLTAGGGDP